MDSEVQPDQQSSFPQSSAIYAEEKDVFGTLMNAMQELVALRPPNPVKALVRYFMRKSQTNLRIAIIGAPFSGRRSLALQLAEIFDVPILEYDRLCESADPQVVAAAAPYYRKHEPLPPEVAFSLLRQRIFDGECVEKGWILCGFPETRGQDELFRHQGIRPQKIIILNANLDVLISRRRHMRYDPVDKRSYNTKGHMPVDDAIIKRLVKLPHESKTTLGQRVRDFAYEAALIMKRSADLSQEDPCCVMIDGTREMDIVFNDALHFVSIQPIQHRPYMHRLLFLGRPGTGKKTMAHRFAEAFRLDHVSSGALIMQAATDPDHEHFREINALLSHKKPIPDDIVGEMVSQSLKASELHGFVLRGFPQNHAQAELLDSYGFRPSKVFFFDCPSDIAKERILMRGKELRKKAAQLQEVYETQQYFKAEELGDRKLGFVDEETQIFDIETQDNAYLANSEELAAHYQDIAYHIDVTMSEHDVFGQIKYHLVHPAPLRPRSQKPAKVASVPVVISEH